MQYGKISGFTDEIGASLAEQLEGAKQTGLRWICLRNIDGKNICELSPDEAASEVLPELWRNGLGVSSLGSPLGKIPVDDDEAFENQLVLAENAARVAKLLGCGYIRLFSFYIPKGDSPDQWRRVVLDKLGRFVEILRKHGIVALHENEKDIFGDTAARCAELFEAIDDPYFKGIFDFANFVQCGENPWDAWQLLKPRTVYFHIKDANRATGETVVCGEGDGRIETILRDAIESGYRGYLTLEPHLVLFDGLDKLEQRSAGEVIKANRAETGLEAFQMQCDALKEILDRITV